jgi:hypothetical protein
MNIEADEALSIEAGDGGVRKEIARLEAHLDELADSLVRCRKVKLVSQIVLAGGGLWMAAATVGLVSFDPVAFMAATAGVIGGIVMYGSNATTAQELGAEVMEAEAKRVALISTLDLRLVGE